MTDPLRLSIENSIASLIINRFERRNAMTIDMWELIPRFIDEACADSSVQLVVLRSEADGVFCSGADLGDMQRAMTDTDFAARNLAAIKGASAALEACPLPTIAVVKGMCLGGGSALAASADIRLAAHTASFAMTPAKLGLFYPIEDTARILSLIGPARLKRLLFSGDRITANQAYDYGFVEEVFEEDSFDRNVESFLSRLIERSSFTQWRTKEHIALLTAAQIREADAAFVAAQTGDDAHEGMQAFREKRAPNFKWRRP